MSFGEQYKMKILPMTNCIKVLLLAIYWMHFGQCDESIHYCSNRFEFMDDIKEALPQLKNCTYVRWRYPVCDQRIHVLYSHQPPYVIHGSQDPTGFLPDMIRLIFKVCCHGCANISFHGPLSPLEKFKSHINATLFIPVESAFKSKLLFGKDYIPLTLVQRVSFLAKELSNRSKEYTIHLTLTILQMWPLLLTALLMASISGSVIWVLDTWYNQEDFPARFPRGIFEGFWWAFVSMTTVGYGDRAPKSVFARIFAIFWILLGVTIFSMYTAVLSSALNAKSSALQDTEFAHEKIGVLSYTGAGEAAALQEHAEPTKYSSIEQLTQAILDDSVKAIALDENMARYHTSDLKKKITNIRRHHAISSLKNSYGTLSYKINVTILLRSFLETNDDQRHALETSISDAYHNDGAKLENNSVDATKYFSSDSSMFYGIILGLVLFFGMMSVFGISCTRKCTKYTSVLQGFMDRLHAWRLKIRPLSSNVIHIQEMTKAKESIVT